MAKPSRGRRSPLSGSGTGTCASSRSPIKTGSSSRSRVSTDWSSRSRVSTDWSSRSRVSTDWSSRSKGSSSRSVVINTGSSSRSRVYTGPDSRSSSRSASRSLSRIRSRSRTFSSPSFSCRSVSSRSPITPPLRKSTSPRRASSPPRRSPIGRRRGRSPIHRPARSGSPSVSQRRGRALRRGRSSSYSKSPRRLKVARRSRNCSSRRKASSIEESRVLRIDNLSKNVTEGSVKEEFGSFGKLVSVKLAMDETVDPPKVIGYVEFKERVKAEIAQLYMNGSEFNGTRLDVDFTLSPLQKVSPPLKANINDNIGVDGEKGGLKRQREAPPHQKPLASPRRSLVAQRGGSPRRLSDSPICFRAYSLVRRQVNSPYRRGDRPTSPGRGPSPPSHNRSPARVLPFSKICCPEEFHWAS